MRYTVVQLAVASCLLPACTSSTGTTKLDRPSQGTEVVEQRWPSGQLRLRKQVLIEPDGTVVNNGTYTRWYDSGRKEYEATFAYGKKHGTATRWHHNGQKWREEHYLNGKIHGLTTLWDAGGRRLKEERHYAGKPHGKWTLWHKDGRIKWQVEFEHGAVKP